MEGHPATSHGTVSSGATPQPPRAPQAGLHVSPDSCPGAVARVAVAGSWAGGNFPERRRPDSHKPATGPSRPHQRPHDGASRLGQPVCPGAARPWAPSPQSGLLRLNRSWKEAREPPRSPSAQLGLVLSCVAHVATRQARRWPPGPLGAARRSWATGSAGSWLPLWLQTPESPGSYKAAGRRWALQGRFLKCWLRDGRATGHPGPGSRQGAVQSRSQGHRGLSAP